ncbi:Predicted protein (fragment) [uncultured delta proteobacterium]|uniref:Lipoprotein n=1 Tax=uncultured delta proteobacterium TaxID=34034 RepID=A0A212J246_9DELT
MRYFLPALLLVLGLGGCMMTTPPAEVKGTQVSESKYMSYDCPQLTDELQFLSRREEQLARAQDRRLNSSQLRAFITGFGRGDGVEATQLAEVRGEKEAVCKAMERKSCPQQLLSGPAEAGR